MIPIVAKHLEVGIAAMSLRANCQQGIGLVKPGNITLSVNFKSPDLIALD
jgi:hypothetical protein